MILQGQVLGYLTSRRRIFFTSRPPPSHLLSYLLHPGEIVCCQQRSSFPERKWPNEVLSLKGKNFCLFLSALGQQVFFISIFFLLAKRSLLFLLQQLPAQFCYFCVIEQDIFFDFSYQLRSNYKIIRDTQMIISKGGEQLVLLIKENFKRIINRLS